MSVPSQEDGPNEKQLQIAKYKFYRYTVLALFALAFVVLSGMVTIYLETKSEANARLEFDKERLFKSDALEHDRLKLERDRFEAALKGSGSAAPLSQDASLQILRDFIKKMDRGDGMAPDVASKLVDSMAEAGTITASTAKGLTTEFGKEAVKQLADGTKQIVVKLASEVIERFIKKDPEKEAVAKPSSPLVVNVYQPAGCGCLPPPKPCTRSNPTPPHTPPPPPQKPRIDCSSVIK